MYYYKDEDIIIRDIIAEDAISLFSWQTDKELNRYDPRPLPKNSTELFSECTSFCRRFDTEYFCDNIKARQYRYFIITDKNACPIGFVNLFSIDIEKKQAEMGVMIGDKRYWSKGLAYKAVSLAMEYAFLHMDIKRIYIETGESNLPALRLFSKLGFEKCGEYLEEEDFKFIVMEKTK